MDRSELEKTKGFGIALGVFLSAIALIRTVRGHKEYFDVFVGFAAASVIVSLFAPRILVPLFRGSSLIGKGLLWINTRIFLFLVFYLLVTPLALVLRAMRKDPLDRRFRDGSQSYWKRRSRKLRASIALKRQF